MAPLSIEQGTWSNKDNSAALGAPYRPAAGNFERPPRNGRKMNKAADLKTCVSAFNAGHPGVTTSIAQAGFAELLARVEGNANLQEHRSGMGAGRDGMGGCFRSSVRPEAHAGGLLANLLRRI